MGEGAPDPHLRAKFHHCGLCGFTAPKIAKLANICYKFAMRVPLSGSLGHSPYYLASIESRPLHSTLCPYWIRAQRAHSQRRWLVDSGRPTHGKAVGLVTGCAINNKADVLCRTIVDKDLDLLVITETWHEGSESAALKRSTPTGVCQRCTVNLR